MKHLLLLLVSILEVSAAVEPSLTQTILGREKSDSSFAHWQIMRQREPVPGQVEEVWDDANKLSEEAQIGVACLWVCMVAGIPLLIRFLDRRQSTTSQKIITAFFLCAVLGGLLLFTNVVKFNSGHFNQVRTLNIIECIYLMSQVITTVGYGDITPAFPRGQVFVGLYVLSALFIIAMLVSELVSHVANATKAYKEKIVAARAKRAQQEAGIVNESQATTAREHDALAARKVSALQNFIGTVETPKPDALIGAAAVFSFFAITWIFFFHFYPGEGKTWLQAVYMSVITLSTVGFGAFTPNTPGGQVFAAFWMIFGSAALVSVVTGFAELMMKIQDYERYDPEEGKDAFRTFKEKFASDEVDELELLKFGLVQRGLVTEADLDLIKSSFKEFQHGDSGMANLEEITSYLDEPNVEN